MADERKAAGKCPCGNSRCMNGVEVAGETDDERKDRVLSNFKSVIAASTWYKKFIESDAVHKQCFLSNWRLGGQDFMHFMFFLNTITEKQLSRTTAVSHEGKCLFCANARNPNYVNMYKLLFYQNKAHYEVMLNTFFNCNALLVQQVFEMVLPPCFPHQGTYAWDLHIFLRDRFAKMNNLRTVPSYCHGKVLDHIDYHGVIYKEMTDDALFLNALSILERYLLHGRTRHALLYSTKSITSPEHWCGVFIDFKCSAAFFYNSLAKHEQLDMRLLSILKRLLEIARPGVRMEFYTNTDRLQNDSKLCGLFVFDFFTWMARQESAHLVEFFKKNTKSQDFLDDVVSQRMKTYIHEMPHKDMNLFDSFFSHHNHLVMVDQQLEKL